MAWFLGLDSGVFPAVSRFVGVYVTDELNPEPDWLDFAFAVVFVGCRTVFMTVFADAPEQLTVSGYCASLDSWIGTAVHMHLHRHSGFKLNSVQLKGQDWP